MKKLIFLTTPLFFLSIFCLAQRPVVTGVSPLSGTVNSTVTITGANLPTGTNAHVQFGAATGTVLEATSTQIKVTVPPGATYDKLKVTNLSSALSATSTSPFQLSFDGNSLDLTKFAAEVSTTGNTAMFDVCSCDLNSDGKVDAVTTHENSLSLSAFRNTSTLATPAFSKTSIVLNAYSRNVICGDLDGDGRPDLIVSGTGTYSSKLYLLRNLSSAGGAITFSTPTIITLPTNGAAMLAQEDLNADGRPEVIITSRSINNVSIFRNASTPGMLQFDNQAVDISIAGAPNTHGLSVQDLDGDGLADLAVSPYQGSNVYLLRNTSTGNAISFSAAATIPTDAGLIYLTAADLNGDRKLDLASSNFFGNQLWVWANNSSPGNIQFGSSIRINTGSRPWGLAAGDLDGNGKPELVVGQVESRSLFVVSNISTTGAIELMGSHLITIDNGRHTNMADYNGDGKPDLSYTGTTGNTFRVLRNMNCVVPRLSHSGIVTLCSGQTLQLQATQALGVTYRWTRDGVALTNSESSLTISEAGNYAVIISSSIDGCSITSEVLQVVAGGGSGSAVAMEPIVATCAGGTIELKATALEGATYVWSGPNGFTATTTSPTYTLANVQAAAAGTYNVVIRTGECEFTPAGQALVVHANPQPQISTATSAFCAGTSQTLQGQTGFASYQWKRNGVIYNGLGATTATIVTNVAGSYTLVVTNSTGCSAESPAVTITEVPRPTAAFSAPTEVCQSLPVAFQNTSTYQSNQSPTFFWEFGDGQTSTEANPTHTYAATGTYSVSLRVGYGTMDCASSVTSLPVTVVAIPDIQLIAEGSTAFCPGDSVLLQVIGDVAAVSWNTGATTYPLWATESGTYTASITTTAGCSLEKSIVLTHLEQPQLSLTASSQSIKLGESVTITAGGALTYEWQSSADISDSYASSITVTPRATTTYTIRGWGENGCSQTTEITIDVDNSLRINPPKIFVPATDGTWSITDIEYYPELSLSIVNSLGRSIFQTRGYTNSWDGTEQGKTLEAGVYYYIFKDASGKVLKTGSITLFR